LDKFDAATRSRIMSRNRATGTRSTERRFRSFLIRSAIRGWKLGHNSRLIGNPDFVFTSSHLLIFIDGCFWHGCQSCRSIPVTNRSFWRTKIHGNKTHDRKVTRLLKNLGWRVIRIWEHELRAKDEVILDKLMRRGMSKDCL
jgi:DNA mismatch endonuclease (patch repair protein)